MENEPQVEKPNSIGMLTLSEGYDVGSKSKKELRLDISRAMRLIIDTVTENDIASKFALFEIPILCDTVALVHCILASQEEPESEMKSARLLVQKDLLSQAAEMIHKQSLKSCQMEEGNPQSVQLIESGLSDITSRGPPTNMM